MPAVTAHPGPSPTRMRLGAALGLILALSACGAPPSADLIRDTARDAAREANRAANAIFTLQGSSPQTRRLSAPIAPAARPAIALDRTVTARDPRTSAALRLRPARLSGGAVEVRQSDGCTWQRGDWFAPSSAWSNCGDSRNWHTGRATVSGGAGLWPLRVGAQTRFDRNAVSHTGRTLARSSTCRVRDAVEVVRPGRAATPAFVVDCADGKRVRTTWWAPNEGPIAFGKRHSENGIEELWVAQ